MKLNNCFFSPIESIEICVSMVRYGMLGVKKVCAIKVKLKEVFFVCVDKTRNYLELDDSFIGSCCLMLDWLTFGAFVALWRCTGGVFETNGKIKIYNRQKYSKFQIISKKSEVYLAGNTESKCN